MFGDASTARGRIAEGCFHVLAGLINEVISFVSLKSANVAKQASFSLQNVTYA